MDKIIKAKIKTKNGTKVVKMGSVKDVGVKNLENFSKNFKEINKRIKLSRNSGFYIESISLQLQSIDLWLRLLINKKTGRTFTFEEKCVFGYIIEESKRFLPPQLYEKIDKFNEVRREAIHKFIYGGTSYEEIKRISDSYKSLHVEVFKFIVKEFSK